MPTRTCADSSLERSPGAGTHLHRLACLELSGNCLDPLWRKRSPAEVRALFDAHGLTGDFWPW